MRIALSVNGSVHEVDVPAHTLLVDVLREHLGLTGTHVGCDTSQCGACTVHADGRAIKSCSLLAVQAQDMAITTIEGIIRRPLSLKLRMAIQQFGMVLLLMLIRLQQT